MPPSRALWRQFVHLLRFEFIRARWALFGYSLSLVAIMLVIVLFGNTLEPFNLFGDD